MVVGFVATFLMAPQSNWLFLSLSKWHVQYVDEVVVSRSLEQSLHFSNKQVSRM